MTKEEGASVHVAEAAQPSPVDAEATGPDTHASDDECGEGYAGPSVEAPPKTARVEKRAGACPELDDDETEWYDDVIAMLTPRASREASPSGSPRGEAAADEGAGLGFLDNMMGSISDSVGNMVGAMKFWEGDGIKSPRHHFNEGEIFKGMFSSQQEDGSDKNSTAQAAGHKATSGSEGSQDESGLVASPRSPEHPRVLLPCIREQGTPSSKTGCRVKFEAVQWRNHEVMMDGSGGLPSSGIPLGIGWKVEAELELSIDEFEEARQAVRRPRDVFMMDGFVLPRTRAELFYQVGYTKEEVSACELATFKTNRRRKASVQDLSDMDN